MLLGPVQTWSLLIKMAANPWLLDHLLIKMAANLLLLGLLAPHAPWYSLDLISSAQNGFHFLWIAHLTINCSKWMYLFHSKETYSCGHSLHNMAQHNSWHGLADLRNWVLAMFTKHHVRTQCNIKTRAGFAISQGGLLMQRSRKRDLSF